MVESDGGGRSAFAPGKPTCSLENELPMGTGTIDDIALQAGTVAFQDAGGASTNLAGISRYSLRPPPP